MPKVKLTALAVARLNPPERGQIDYFDISMPAFGVRLSLAGARTYFVMTRIHGKLARLTIGKAKLNDNDLGLSLREAREKAGEWLDLAARGVDPRQMKAEERAGNEEKARNTFKSVGERFMRQYAERRLAANTQREYRRTLFGPDTSSWAHRPIASITRGDVRTVLDSLVERGRPSAANHTLAYLRKFFNWCAEKDLVEIPPTDRMSAPTPNRFGQRVLSEAEIIEVWRAFEAEGGHFEKLFKLLLLTGQRRSEVGGMRRSELSQFDSNEPLWEIPADRTKNRRPHIVPLVPQVIAIINTLPRVGTGDLLFTTTGTKPVSGFSKVKERIDIWIAAERKKADVSPMPKWNLHDLRRTMVTMMNERLRVAPHVVEACVNHISGKTKAGVAGVYNKALYIAERREALTAWADFIDMLLRFLRSEAQT